MASGLRNKVVYYTTNAGENPVREFIDSLSHIQKAKIFRIFELYVEYGLRSIVPHTKHLTGTSLWEIRIKGKDSIRVLYVTNTKNSILVLHGFIKKSQKTPGRELRIAIERYKIWNSHLTVR